MKKSFTEFLPKKADVKPTPVLAESPASRYFSFSLLYFAQGVPEGITFFAIPAWLAMNNISPLAIGSYLAMVGLPWSSKLVLAPLMDRYTIKSMGRKRPWVIFGQIGLVLSFILLSTLHDPLENMGLLMAMGFLISFFGCFQDVATDGMAVDIIPLHEQARANGLMWGTKVIGTSVSLAAGTYMINRFGFSIGVLVPAAFTSVLILVPLYFLERKGEKRFPWSIGEASLESKLLQPAHMLQILRDTYRAASRYSSLILLGIVACTGFVSAYAEALIPLFTIQELGWTNAEFANLFSTANIVGGLLGMLLAGALLDFFGQKKMLFIYGCLWMLALGGFLFYQSTWFTNAIISFIVFAAMSAYVFTTIATFAMGMAHCWKRVSATQFTLYMTFANLGRSAGSATLGYVKENFSWHYTFLLALIVLMVLVLLTSFIQIKRQLKAVNRLELKSLEKVELPLVPDVASAKISQLTH